MKPQGRRWQSGTGIVPISMGCWGAALSVGSVGRKTSSLAKRDVHRRTLSAPSLPFNDITTTSFSQPWVDVLSRNNNYAQIICRRARACCLSWPLDYLSNIIATELNHSLAAVWSGGTVEEDGSYQSYAGMFETKLPLEIGMGRKGLNAGCFIILPLLTSNTSPVTNQTWCLSHGPLPKSCKI